MTFSPKYKTFQDWVLNFNGSESYRNRITREHSKYPQASLSQLRGHAPEGKKAVSELKAKPLYKRDWSSLSPKNKADRVKTLKVLSKARNEKLSLTQITRNEHTAIKSVIKNTNAFKKVNGKWIPKKYDRISRSLIIYENGAEKPIVVKDSRYATAIGKYHNTVKQFLETGDSNVLKPFKNKKIKDAQGNAHILETDPDELMKIIEAQEEPEFFEIYDVH